jgi:Spy/CpxP family protein refolding chaperone
MKKKWIALALVLGLAVATLGYVAYAQEKGMGRAESRGHEFMAGGGFSGMGGFHGRAHMARKLLAMLDNPRFKQSLGLTDEQSGQLRKIIVDGEKSAIKARADLAVRGIELRELLRADHPDREAVMKKADDISALRAQMMKQHLDSLLAAKSVLTPEQQARIRSFLERRAAGGSFMRERFFNRRGSMPGMGSGRPVTPPQPPAPPKE